LIINSKAIWKDLGQALLFARQGSVATSSLQPNCWQFLGNAAKTNSFASETMLALGCDERFECQIMTIRRIVAEILMSLIVPCRWFLSHVPLFRARIAQGFVVN
jgi:hypothetical protein